ncbi:Uncharacterised protein [Legionella steigerwaltii]|uniref:Uncharacterized protein n=1 Tax=Legionella steigerwaltii TaxID=460 RepID=A0A378L6H7_9GAMM|nr:hypothetical protein [Legionella steigerwaltii]KTD77460.1 hypothetical protein Lstg_1817 [Legionella steigerwaltii]STY22685.1 Uncharacterised protein [Legionella steigerwaltii]
MHISLNKFLVIILLLILIGLYYTSRPNYASKLPVTVEEKDDATICAELPTDPATLPFISYNTQEGFDECVSRCMTSVMKQVCRQLPHQSNFFSTHPELKQQMLDGCTQNIKHFVTNNTRCPYLHCEP